MSEGSPPPLRYPSRLPDGALELLCTFQAQRRYASPSGMGYMPMAFAAAHRRLRVAAEGSSTAGFALFFFARPDDDTDKREGEGGGPQPSPPLSCRGCLSLREEEETAPGLAAMGLAGGGSSGRYLTISCTPPSLLEEYLPLLRWWLPNRYSSDSDADGSKEASGAPMGVQLFLRDAANTPERRRQLRLLTSHPSDPQHHCYAPLLRQRTMDAMAVCNAASLLAGLAPSTSSSNGRFLGLVSLKLVNYPLTPTLLDAVAAAGAGGLRVLNLSCCTGLTEEDEEEGGGGQALQAMAAAASVSAAGCLSSLRALLLPATDATDTTLRSLVALTAPYHRLAYVNVGECPALTDLSPLVALKGALRCLHAYCLPRLDATVALETVVAAGGLLEVLCLARCPTVADLRPLTRQGRSSSHPLARLRLLDLQGCTGLGSLHGVIPRPPPPPLANVDDENSNKQTDSNDGICGGSGGEYSSCCPALERLWLTGCTALRLGPADQRAVLAHSPRLQDLQLGFMPLLFSGEASSSQHKSDTIPTGSSGSTVHGTLDLSGLPSDAPLRVLCLPECASLTAVLLPLRHPLRQLTLLDLSGTAITATTLISLCGGGDGGCAPSLHTLVLNGCTAIDSFTALALPALQRLSLAGTGVTSDDLARIAAGCPAVQALNLNYCQRIATTSTSGGGGGLQCLRLSQTVRVLSLAHTGSAVGNTALQHVAAVPFLQVVSLQGTAVTDLLRLGKAPYLKLVECGGGGGKTKALKNVHQLAKGGVRVDLEAPAPPLRPPMAFVS